MKQQRIENNSSNKPSGRNSAQQPSSIAGSAITQKVLQLQKQYGNAGTTRMLSGMIQRKIGVIQRLSEEEKHELRTYVETELAGKASGYEESHIKRILLVAGHGTLEAAKKAVDSTIAKWLESGALNKILPKEITSANIELEKQATDGAAEIYANLKAAAINFVGSRWNAHLLDVEGSDGAAKITKDEAIDHIRDGSNLRYLVGCDKDSSKSYSIKYNPKEKLSIIFSTSDEGNTLNVFHIGPGG